MCLRECFPYRIKYILNLDLSILNIFQILEINGFVNYLLLNKYGNVFPIWSEFSEILSFKDKLKMNIRNRFENRIFIDILEL